MLSQEAIERLAKPILDRQEAINLRILKLIAKRIMEIGELLPSDVYKLERLLKTGADVQKINNMLAETTNLQVTDIKQLIRTVALDAYIDTKPYFDYRHKPFIPFNENKPLQNVVKAIEKQTAGTYENLSKAQAFMLRDPKNPKKFIPTSPAKTYTKVVDEAIQTVQSGTENYKSTMRRTLKQLIDSGIRWVKYQTEKGRFHTQRLDTAVRRNLMDGIRNINQEVQNEVGRQFGATGKEISVHAYSAPDHEPIQGHQFTDAEWEKLQNDQPFEDILGNKFDAIKRPIGIWNCRHFAWSIIVGVTKPNYTLEQLEKFKEDNNKGYTLPNGKHYTMYECSQIQRQMETNIRRLKEGQIAARQAGDDFLAKEYQAKVSSSTKEYVAFSNACGLKYKPDRLEVSGYKKIRTK